MRIKKTALISLAVFTVLNLSGFQVARLIENSTQHQPVENQINYSVSAEPLSAFRFVSADRPLGPPPGEQADGSASLALCEPTPVPPTPIPPKPPKISDEPEKPAPNACRVEDGRANASDCAAPVAVYCQDSGFNVFVISTQDGHGSLLTTVSADEIARAGLPKDQNVVVKAVDGVVISRLTTGEFQINAVQSDGKPYIYIWDGCGPVSIIESAPPDAVCKDCLLYHTMMTGDWEIWRLGEWPGVEEGDPNISRGLNARDVAPSRSPDNRWVIFASDRDGRWEIFRSAVSGSQIERLTDDPEDSDVDPVWSPKEALVVFEHNGSGNWDLSLLNLNTHAEMPLVATSGNDVNAVWSPDGRKLLFQSDYEGLTQIYEVTLATREIRRVSDGLSAYFDPVYAADGQHLAFIQNAAGQRSVIYTMRLDGTEMQIVSSPMADADNLTWSRDSRLIAYDSNVDGDLDIYVYDRWTDTTRQLTDNLISDYAPVWMCNSNTLVFTSDAAGNPDIFQINALPITAPPVDVLTEAVQLTSSPEEDLYPEGWPAEEDASREDSGLMPPCMNMCSSR